jgi:hypothetical protein
MAAFSSNKKPHECYIHRVVITNSVQHVQPRDLFYQTKRLKNSWKENYIDISFDLGRLEGGVHIDAPRAGTDSPYLGF